MNTKQRRDAEIDPRKELLRIWWEDLQTEEGDNHGDEDGTAYANLFKADMETRSIDILSTDHVVAN